MASDTSRATPTAIREFVRRYTVRSAYAVRLDQLYEQYRTEAGRPVTPGTFRWLVRMSFDTVWLGRPLGGEWLVGRELADVAEGELLGAHPTALKVS